MTGEIGIFVPVDRRLFGEYITDLLGQRRRIEASLPCHILIADLDGVKNVVEIVVQRVSQNEAKLVSFQASIYYESGIRRTVPSLDAFRNYYDTTPDKSIGIDISMTALVVFPNVQLPEKQEIRIEISENIYSKMTVRSIEDEKFPAVRYVIESSNLTWGEDISTHLYNQLRTITHEDLLAKLSTLLRKPSTWVTGTVAIFATFGIVAGKGLATKNAYDFGPELERQISIISKFGETPSVQAKLDLILRILTASNNRPDDYLWRFTGIAGISMLIGGLAMIAAFGGFHAVALNTFSKKAMDARIERRKNWKWAICASLIVGTIASLAATHIDKWFLGQ